MLNLKSLAIIHTHIFILFIISSVCILYYIILYNDLIKQIGTFMKCVIMKGYLIENDISKSQMFTL